jgi:Protein of unknown function (DUF3379)
LEFDWQKMSAAPPSAPPMVAPGAGDKPAPEATATTAAPNVVVLPRPVPTPLPKQKRPRLVALAASVVAALIAALTLWLSRPPETLAAEIVKHVEGEPNSWYKTQPLQGEQINAVLRKSGLRLGPGMPSIVYANSCFFRGHFVPHLVVTTQDGPVTVMILANEKVTAPQHFNEDGFEGLLVPAPTGSVAVLSRKPMPLERPASDVVKALQP